jgi:hypothetical protein
VYDSDAAASSDAAVAGSEAAATSEARAPICHQHTHTGTHTALRPPCCCVSRHKTHACAVVQSTKVRKGRFVVEEVVGDAVRVLRAPRSCRALLPRRALF